MFRFFLFSVFQLLPYLLYYYTHLVLAFLSVAPTVGPLDSLLAAVTVYLS